MTKIKEQLLADAKSRKPQYADRMTLIGPQRAGLPDGLEHYGIKISKLHDYTPINYIVKDDEYFTSMQRGDFSRLLQKLRLMEDQLLSAADLTALFVLIENPFAWRHLVDTLEDLTLPTSVSMRERLQLSQKIGPAHKQIVNQTLECVFYAFNARTQALERFLFRVTPNYLVEGKVDEIATFKE